MVGRLARNKVLVTGAGGFVGANLVRRLEEEGAEIYALVRETTDLWRLHGRATQTNLVTADLLEYKRIDDLVGSIQPNYVFHTATTRSEVDWKRTLDTNITATINLLESAATPSLRRFVHCGSSLEYGTSGAPFTETDELRPDSFFGACKAGATMHVRQMALSQSLPAVVLRLFHTYGQFEAPHRLVPTAIRAGLRNRTLPLTGKGMRHDLVFVDDVVEACLMAATQDGVNGEVFNIASGQQWTNEEVVAEIGAVMGRPIQTETGKYKPRQWDRPNWIADISHARNGLGWRPRHDLQAGLAKTMEWIISYDQ